MIATSALRAPAPSSSGLAARRGFITLGAEAWEAIRTEYQAGATAKQIRDKWGCSVVAVYDHASKGGWTKRARGAALSRSVLEDVQAERAERAARALQPPPEADPLMAARLLLRQAAASALCGRGVEAFEGVRMAESLARCSRLLSEAEHGIVEARAELLAEAKQALEDDPDYEPPGWRDSEEDRKLRDDLLRSFKRLRRERGRAPPQVLPQWFALDEYPASRSLAEAMGLVVEGRGWVECPDFDAAMDKARAEGRGEAIDAALSTPVPWALCVWLSDEDKAAVLAREAETARLADAAAAEVASGVGWTDDEAVEAWPEPERAAAESGPGLVRLDEGSTPWGGATGRAPGISGPLRFLS